MDKKALTELLRSPREKDWLEFKGKFKLYEANGNLVEPQRDEFIKDILGLANGNAHIVRKTKYLVIGADNEKFDETGMRVLHNVDYKVPSQSDIAVWLKAACSPTIVGVECETVSIQGVNLFIVTIPPTFDLHETKRELITPNAKFNTYTVFMRQDEHTIPASVHDGITIQERKQLYRREIANPPALLIGIVSGGIVGFIIGGAKINSTQVELPISGNFLRFLFVGLGIFFGAWVGWIGKQIKEGFYDWRYYTTVQRIATLVLLLILFVILYFTFPK